MGHGLWAIGRTERQKQRTKGYWQLAMGDRQYAPHLPDLIQFILRRADLVKLMIFFDKARALCGRPLKDQL